jgi:hypothetical protein
LLQADDECRPVMAGFRKEVEAVERFFVEKTRPMFHVTPLLTILLAAAEPVEDLQRAFDCRDVGIPTAAHSAPPPGPPRAALDPACTAPAAPGKDFLLALGRGVCYALRSAFLYTEAQRICLVKTDFSQRVLVANGTGRGFI